MDDPIAQLDAFMLKEEELYSLFDRERAIKLARFLSNIVVVLGVAGLGLWSAIAAAGSMHNSTFAQQVLGVLLVSLAFFVGGWWCAYHDRQFGAASGVVGGLLVFSLGVQIAWEVASGFDAFTVALFMLTALPIGLSGVLGEAKVMVGTVVGVVGASAAICFFIPGHEHLSPGLSLLILVIVAFVQIAIAGCIILAASFYLNTLHQFSIIGKAYREIRRLDAMREVFVSNVNHELRTPFMTLGTDVETLYLAHKRLSPEARTKHLTRAYEAVERIRDILDNVLNFGRTGTAGVGPVDVGTVPVELAVEHALALTELMVPLGTHTIRTNIDDGIRIWGNSPLLEEALANLLTNAHKYSAPTAPIEIVAHLRQLPGVEDPQVEIRVRDYGLGIPPEDAHLIFQRLSRLQRDIEGPIPGSGLGLALCKVLINAMGGTISFESTGRAGEGTVFIIRLPAPPVEAPLRTASQPLRA